MKMLAIAAAASLAGVAAFAQGKPAGAQLSHAELTQTFVAGTIVIGDSPIQGLSFTRLFLRGGVLHQLYADADGNGSYVVGRWRIDQDNLCTTWVRGMGSELCGPIYKLPDGSYETWYGDNPLTTFRVKPPPVATAFKPAG